MTKLFRQFTAFALLLAGVLAAPAYAGVQGSLLFLAINLKVDVNPVQLPAPVVAGDFTYGVTCVSSGGALNAPFTFPSPATTFSFPPRNGLTPISEFGFFSSNLLGTQPVPNDCTYTQLTRPTAPAGYLWKGAPAPVVQSNIQGEAPPAGFANVLTPAFNVTTAASPAGGGGVTCVPANPIAFGDTASCTAAANAGYTFANFSTSSCGATSTSNPLTTAALAADCTVTGNFTLTPVNGACGSAISPPTGTAPTANLCAAGTASAVTAAVSQFTWSCAGVGSGTLASCAVGRTYTVTSSVTGGNGTISPTPTQTVAANGQPVFTITPASGYAAAVAGTCGGTLNAAKTSYTANAVVSDCTVIASFTLIPVSGVCGSAISAPTGIAPSANLCSAGTASAVASTVSQFTWSCAGVGSGTSASCAVGRTYTVTSSVTGGNGTIAPTSTQTVASGATPSFTLAPASGYSASVGGTCGGALVGTTYTANAVVADCTVIASFTLIPVTGVCGSATTAPTGIAPSANLCSAGTASAVASTVSQFTWSCAGVGSGTSASCAVGRTYTVTSSATGGNGTISPASTQTVASGATPSFTLAPAAGYSASVGGTCGGTLVGLTYTTSAVAANCTVIATFAANSFPITTVASPTVGGALTCTPNPVTFGSTSNCTAMPNTGYMIAPFVASAAAASASKVIAPAAGGGITGCGGVGSSTNTFTTGAITSACTVTANFVLITVPVATVAVSANGGVVNCAPNPVSFGSTTTCSATANTGFALASISGCGGAATTTSPFVTAAVTAACTVSAFFAPVAVPVVSVPVPTLGGGALILVMLLTMGVGIVGFSIRGWPR